MVIENDLHALGEAHGEGLHAHEGSICEDLVECGPHGRQAEGIAGERATNTAHVDEVGRGGWWPLIAAAMSTRSP